MSTVEASGEPVAYYVRIRGKIQGPFEVAKLKKMQMRGQFSRAHEVSADKRSWHSAAELTDLFSACAPPSAASGDNACFPQDPRVEPAGARYLPSVDSDQWYYHVRDQQHGPVSLIDLQRRIQGGEISANDLVWQTGTADWQAAGRVKQLFPNGTSTSWPKTAWFQSICVAAVVVILALVTILGYRKGADRQTTGTLSLSSIGNSGAVIQSVGAESDLGDALGLVVCGLKIVLPDGAELEKPLSTGSCFAISPDGYVVTNKHVVEKTKNLLNARLLLKQLREKELLDVQPRIWIFFGKEKYGAEIVYVSDNFDLGILKVSRAFKHFFRMSMSDSLPRGKKVIACGFPGAAQTPLSVEEAIKDVQLKTLGRTIEGQFKLRDFEFAMTDGSISRVASEEGNDRKWIQHTANINPGNSGGPLLIEDATVIGINTLGVKEASGVFYSLATPQLRNEIGKHVAGTNWN